MLAFIKRFISNPRLSSKSKKILIIEDSPVDQKVAQSAVEKGGYVALLANNGQKGLALADSEHPDLIILDYNLPDMIGPTICDQLKNNPDTKHIPVLFVTSMETPASVIDCYEKGGEIYLSKPISPLLLLKYIKETLENI